jgi:class 3 adenylate cyclase
MRRHFHLQFHLVVLSAILVLCFAALLSTLADLRLRRTAAEASEATFAATAAAIEREFGRSREIVEGALHFVAASSVSRSLTPASRIAHVSTLIELLGASPAVTAGYIGYPNGSYFYARRLAAGDRARYDAPATADYLVRDLDRAHGTLLARRIFLDRNLRVIARAPERDDLIDPRTRVWFRAARLGRLAVSEPYRLGTSGGAGFSMSVADFSGSVAAVSVGLSDLSGALRSIATPDTQIAMLDDRNRVLALSEPALFRAAAAGTRSGLPAIDAVGMPAIAAAFRALQRTPGRAAGSARLDDGSTILFHVQTTSAPGDPQRRVLIVIPQNALAARYREIRDQTIVLGVVLVVLALPLTWWIGTLIARPLVLLTFQAQSLAQLDFTPRTIQASAVREIDDLATAFGQMRARLAQFSELSTSIARENDLTAIVATTLEDILAAIGAEAGVAYLPDSDGVLMPIVARGLDATPERKPPAGGLVLRSADAREPLQRRALANDAQFGDAFARLDGGAPIRALALPFSNRQGRVVAVVIAARNASSERPFSDSAVAYSRSFAGLTALALETKRYRDDLERYNDAASHFVPAGFLAALDCTDITEMHLGQHRTRTLTVLSSDIRAFTTISEDLGASRTFEFLNLHLRSAAAAIRSAGGFVDRYIGDAIVALFAGDPAQAVRAAIALQTHVRAFNAQRPEWFPHLLQTGVGIDAGEFLIGTIGEPERYATVALSEAAARADIIESRTAQYGAPILISDTVAQQLDAAQFQMRRLPIESDAGEPLTLFEVCDADDPAIAVAKRATYADFALAVALADAGACDDAAAAFAAIAATSPGDVPAQRLRDRYRAMTGGRGTSGASSIASMTG